MKHKILIVCLCFQPLLLWGGQTVRLAADEWPPFTGQHGERHIAQDLVAHALAKAGLKVAVSIGPWQRALAAVQDGRVDGLVAVWRTSRRETVLLYSKPILENRIHAVTLQGSGIKVGQIEDLQGHSVGKIKGYAYGDELDHAKVGRFVDQRNDSAGLDSLLAGDCEILLIDELSLRYLVEELPASERKQIHMQAQLAARKLHFALLRREARAIDIIRAFDVVIGEMMIDGTYNQVLDLPWLMVDSDGDDVHEMVPGPGAMDLEEPSHSDAYSVMETKPVSSATPSRRVYLVNGQQYEDWGDAKQAIIDDSQTERYDPVIQKTPYEIGVPF